MKRMNIDSLGVCEMTKNEMKSTEGGVWIFVALLGLLIGSIVGYEIAQS